MTLSTRAVFAVVFLGLALGACTNSARFYSQAPERPQVFVNAPVQVVRDVISDSAAKRGSAIRLVGDGLILEAPLAESRAEVVSQCGEHRPGRLTRVVLRTVPQGSGTLLSEERFIVDGGNVCALAMSAADASQSRDALTRVKLTAETVQARFRQASIRQ